MFYKYNYILTSDGGPRGSLCVRNITSIISVCATKYFCW